MKILAIDTSCDDTCIALANCKPFEIISNTVSSQVELHQEYGGVYPSLARREHQKNLVPVLIKTLKKAKLLKKQQNNIDEKKLKIILKREEILFNDLKEFLSSYAKAKIDAIAVTVGPGLDPTLWTGINFTKAISEIWNIPIIAVNHIEAHLLSVLLENKKQKFPVIGLIVSGGHTQLVLIKDIKKYKILGETRDDAAGEAFDKIARIIELPYPGGPAISKEAKESKKQLVKLPRPMINTKDYDFSFSGLKTAALYASKKNKITKDFRQSMAKEAQQAIIDVLIKKTIKAAKDFNVKTIFMGGGVAANQELRKQFKEKSNKLGIKFQVAKPKFCTDNAAMIALTACLNKNYKKRISTNPNLRLK